MKVIKYIFLLCFLGIAAYQDIKFKRIPNKLIGSIFLTGLLESFLQKNQADYLINVLLGTGAVLPLFLIRAVGGGDIKLLGVMAGFVGMRNYFICTGWALAIAACFGFVQMLKDGQFRKKMKEAFSYLLFYVSGKGRECYEGLEYKGTVISFSVCIFVGYCMMLLLCWKK